MKRKRGVTTIETVVMLPFLILFLAYLFTGGQIIINRMGINYATQTAARKAAVQPNKEEASKIADKTFKESIEKIGVSVDSCEAKVVSSDTWEKGNFATVQATVKYKTLMPIPSNEESTSFLSKDCTMINDTGLLIEKIN